MNKVIGSTFRGLLKASVACGVVAVASPALAGEGDVTSVDEVVVTGTNIKGATARSHALTVVTRQDIERAGFVDLGQVIRSLPTNFSGGINPETAIAAGTSDNASINRARAASPNLRGLGSGATLTLLNGRRLPAAGEGVAVDLSLIPLGAVERVDVLADGASAIYGADAVAGVVNVVTRQSFDGVEARARYGTARDGLGTYDVSVLTGGKIGRLDGVFAAEYFNQRHLNAYSRELSSRLRPPFTILPDLRKASYYGAVNYEVDEATKVRVNALYTQGLGTTIYGSASNFSVRSLKTSQYAVTGGIERRIGGTWSVDLGGTLGGNVANTPVDSTLLSSGAHVPTVLDRRNDLRSAEANASGALFQLPGGAVDVALGLSYRKEKQASRSDPKLYDKDRSIKSAYVEVNIPIVGEDNRAPLVNELRINLAGRHDDYSDFGGVSVPKAAVVWSPDPAVEFTASYSKSFRAPSLAEMATSYSTSISNARNASGGTTRILFLSGTGRALGPERAKTLNLSLAYRPAWLSGAKAVLSYYDIDYSDRIAKPDPSSVFLSDISAAPSLILKQNPTLAEVNALLAAASYNGLFNGAPNDPSAVTAIVDDRSVNIGRTRMEGFQLRLDYHHVLSAGALDVTSDLNYLPSFADRLLPTSPWITRVGNIFSPTHFRSRSGVQWSSASWSSNIFWNYVDDYVDRRIATKPAPVKAWSTIDASIAYEFGGWAGAIGKGARIVVSATNLFDVSPPRVAQSTGSFPTSWDPTNASIVGRFVSIELVKRW